MQGVDYYYIKRWKGKKFPGSGNKKNKRVLTIIYSCNYQIWMSSWVKIPSKIGHSNSSITNKNDCRQATFNIELKDLVLLYLFKWKEKKITFFSHQWPINSPSSSLASFFKFWIFTEKSTWLVPSITNLLVFLNPSTKQFSFSITPHGFRSWNEQEKRFFF